MKLLLFRKLLNKFWGLVTYETLAGGYLPDSISRCSR